MAELDEGADARLAPGARNRPASAAEARPERGAPPLLRADLCPSPEACCDEACCYLDWVIDRGEETA